MIDWDLLLRGYNDGFGTEHRTVREMLEDLYGRERGQKRMADALGISIDTVRWEMRECGIASRLPGWPRPSRLDKFKSIPIEELERMSSGEIARRIGSSRLTVYVYQHLRRKNYDYEDRNLQSVRRKRTITN